MARFQEGGMWLRRDGHTCCSASSAAYAQGKCTRRSARKADGGAASRDLSPGWQRYVPQRNLA
jgi:hypothetical protein